MQRVREYLRAVDIPWESSTAECARTIQRNTSGVDLGDKLPEACVELAVKLDRQATKSHEDEIPSSIGVSERMLVFHLFDGTRARVQEAERIGKGTFSRVFKGRFDGRRVAVKKFEDCSSVHLDVELIRELAVLRSLHHPAVVEMLAWTMEATTVSIILPLYSGNLRELLRSDVSVTQRQIDACAKDMVLALGHCHRRGVLHRDVKPENILVNVIKGKFSFSLCDFNLARFFDIKRTYTQLVVTLWYRPPELTLASVPVAYSTGVDAWSLGCVLYEALLGRPAFDTEEESIGRVHLHFFAPREACLCRGCKASRVMPSLERTNGFAAQCAVALLRRVHQRATLWDIANRLDEALIGEISGEGKEEEEEKNEEKEEEKEEKEEREEREAEAYEVD